MEVSSRRNTRIRALPPRHVRSADVTQPEVFPFPPSMSTTVDLTKDDAAQPVSVPTTTHISASQAAEIDVKLMGPEYGFTLEQLMELAGLSVAAATQRVFPVTPDTHQHILVLCGPGNNGGDGLVAARHLAHFGYESVFVCYPKRSAREPIYGKLVKQLETLEGVRFLNDAEEAEFVLDFETASIDVVIDAMFGFSFHGAPRSPFDALLHLLKHENNPPPSSPWTFLQAGMWIQGTSREKACAPTFWCPSPRRNCALKRLRGSTTSWAGGFYPPSSPRSTAFCFPSSKARTRWRWWRGEET